MPPAHERTRLSTSNWRTSRPREAPSDSRTAISRWRMKPRAMRRFATLAQAMSSTRPTMHIRTRSGVEKSLRSGEKPIAALTTSSWPFMNCSREYADQFLAAGSVISSVRIWVKRPWSGRARGFDRVARLEPAEDLHPAGPAVVHPQPRPFRRHGGLHQDGHADLRRLRRIDAGKSRRRDADDRHRRVVDEDLLADHVRVARKAADPVVVAQHHDRMPLVDLVVFLRVEDAPQRRLDPQHREVVPGDELRLEPLGAVVDADRGGNEPPAEHLSQRLGLLLVVLVDGIGVHPGAHVAAHVGALLIEHDQLIGTSHRQLAQQHLVDQREDRGVGPDPQGERQDRHSREQRAAAQAANRKAEVGKARKGCSS